MLKRSFDFCAALVLVLLFLPVTLVVAVLVRLFLGAPVLFVQKRPGYKGRTFEIYKFRTMTDARSRDGELLDDAARLTAFGRFLRSTSLDELPQLINVLKGDISLVGPRPLLVEYLPLYSAEQARRHEVRPGITGWAQVNGRNAISWEEKLRLDVWYVDHRSFWLDLKIIGLTAKKVFFRSDISTAGAATANKFEGTAK